MRTYTLRHHRLAYVTYVPVKLKGHLYHYEYHGEDPIPQLCWNELEFESLCDMDLVYQIADDLDQGEAVNLARHFAEAGYSRKGRLDAASKRVGRRLRSFLELLPDELDEVRELLPAEVLV